MKTRLNQAGFSLIELLVVLGIISILITLLLPVIQSSKQKALRIECANNLRSIGTAFHAYHNDHKRLPGGVASGILAFKSNVNGDEVSYVVRLGTLYDVALMSTKSGIDRRNFSCPTHRLDRGDATEAGGLPSYGMNWYYEGQPMPKAKIILATEVAGLSGDGGHFADRDSNPPGQLAQYRHSLRSNYLYADGHVDLLAYEEAAGPQQENWGTDHRKSGPPVMPSPPF